MHRFADSNYIIEEEFLRRNVMLYSLWKYKLLLFLIILFFVCSIICQIVPVIADEAALSLCGDFL